MNTTIFTRTLALATAALALLPAVAAGQAPPPRSYTFSIQSEPGAPYASGSFAESTFGEASERPTPVPACVSLRRQEQGGTRKRPTWTTVTESGCGTLDLFLPYAGAGSLSGAVQAESGGELRVEDVALQTRPAARVGHATPPKQCDFLPPLWGPSPGPFCHVENAAAMSVAVGEGGTARGTVRSTGSGATASGTGELWSRRWTCVGLMGCPR